MSADGAFNLKSSDYQCNLIVNKEHVYDKIDRDGMSYKRRNKPSEPQKEVKHSGWPVPLKAIISSIITAIIIIILVIIVAVVYFIWKNNTDTKIMQSLSKKLEILQANFDVEWTIRNRSLFGCENNWRLYKGHCYYFGHQNKTFDDAQDMCAFCSGSLVKIDDEAEDSWLKRYITADSWIGGNKTDMGRNYTWLDGTHLVHKGWQENEPNNSGFCVQYWYSRGKYAWDDDRCMFAKSFVCEKNAKRINVVS